VTGLTVCLSDYFFEGWIAHKDLIDFDVKFCESVDHDPRKKWSDFGSDPESFLYSVLLSKICSLPL